MMTIPPLLLLLCPDYDEEKMRIKDAKSPPSMIEMTQRGKDVNLCQKD